MMIDTHCHLSRHDYSNLEEIINHMDENVMICSGADTKYNKEVIDLISKYDNIYGTIGLHPDEAETFTKEDLDLVEKNLSNSKIVGLGEIGLDYRFGKENALKQKDLFLYQLNLARKYNKPVVIHTRDAIQDTYDILKDYKDLKIVLHCYSSNYEMAKEFIKLGVKFGIGGVVTFKNGKKLQEVVEKIPMDYFLLETDSPYLTPEPYRGTTNEPYNITLVAKKIAEIKGISVEEVYRITTKNACDIFNISK